MRKTFDYGSMFDYLSPCCNSNSDFGVLNTKVKDVKDDCKKEFGTLKEFTKSDLQELDIVVLRNGYKLVWFKGVLRGDGARSIMYYENNLLRSDNLMECDIMQIIRNKEVIWERVEKSPIQIELEKLEKEQRAIADKIAELQRKV